MNKKELYQYIGSMQQLAFVRPITFNEGRAKGIQGFDIKNGDLRFQVAGDKCLDIIDFNYKGVNINFLSKQGLIGRADYDTHGEEGVRSLMGGLLFTCGLENTCIPCQIGDTSYPMHGRIRSTPAEHINSDACWNEDDYVMSVSGEMREAEIFGKNLTLKRTIQTKYGDKSIYLTDLIENSGYQDEPMMILYHFNFGYPLLDEDAVILLPTYGAKPRDKNAQKDADKWNQMEAPIVQEPERVYLHELYSDVDGNTFACLYNLRMELGVRISFNKKYLPRFVQWKSIAASDYVMGLEPTNSDVYGRAHEGEAIHKIPPFGKETIDIKITILEGKEDYERTLAEIKHLLSM
ncbi:MAG: aldose 1-epimerase family protein [Lachnospiraceae bacterium]